MIEKLEKILRIVQKEVGNDFSGLGILICSDYSLIPIFPLKKDYDLDLKSNLIDSLILISNINHPLHDGFHILDTNFNLVYVSQYFSPPIAPNLSINYEKNFGGRYLAAMFGSTIPGVSLSGIISNAFGMAIFESGKEILYESNL